MGRPSRVGYLMARWRGGDGCWMDMSPASSLASTLIGPQAADAPGAVGVAGRLQGVDLVEFLPRRRRVVAGDAGAAEPVGGQADRAGQGLNRQVAETVGPQFGREPG